MADQFIPCLCKTGKAGEYCKFTKCKKYMKKETEVISAMVWKKVGIKDGVGTIFYPHKHACIVMKGKVQPFQEGVCLFHVGKKWYLQYNHRTSCTGGFETKRKAIEWWVRGGR